MLVLELGALLNTERMTHYFGFELLRGRLRYYHAWLFISLVLDRDGHDAGDEDRW